MKKLFREPNGSGLIEALFYFACTIAIGAYFIFTHEYPAKPRPRNDKQLIYESRWYEVDQLKMSDGITQLVRHGVDRNGNIFQYRIR